jgi:alpha-L-arabinofuranosidase
MVKHFKEAGFSMAKWPGGNFVSAYDWHDGLGDPDKRPPRVAPMRSGMVESNDVGLHEFIAFYRLLGAKPYVTANSGFGEARVAAEEVEYANGHPEPLNVRLWCIGNEMYGPWQFGQMSLEQYAVKYNYFVTAMRKVDQKIQVALAVASPCESSWCATEQKQFEPSVWQVLLTEKLPFKFRGTKD